MGMKKRGANQKFGWGLGQQHPLRYQAEDFYKGKPELSGTPAYGADWLSMRDTSVPRFRGIMPKKEREARQAKGGRGGGGSGATAPININMFTNTENRNVTNTTNNNYMGGRGFVDDSEPDWGSPGSEFADAGFEPMDHDLYNVRERGGGNWEQPIGELGTGATGIGTGDEQGALGI
jgi:hypothetical protein